MKLPKGFTLAKGAPDNLNYTEKRIVFEDKKSPGTKICYSKDEGWTPTKDSQEALKKLLSQRPHRLSDEEIDAISDIIPKPPFGARGSFTVTGLSTRIVDNKTVLAMELNQDNSDRRVYGYFFSPKYNKIDDAEKIAPPNEAKVDSASAGATARPPEAKGGPERIPPPREEKRETEADGKLSQKTGSLECIWFESSSKEFARRQKDVLAAIHAARFD